MMKVFWWTFWIFFLFSLFVDMFDEDRAVERIVVSSLLNGLIWGAIISWIYALVHIVLVSGV